MTRSDSGSVGRTYGGESADARAGRRRQQLLAAGREVIGGEGFRRATVRRLCRAARVADRVFYEEFSSAEDLLLAVYHECLDQLEREVLAAVARSEARGADLEGTVRAGLDALFGVVEADRCLGRLVWFEVLGVDPRVDAAYLERTERFGDLLRALVEERGLDPAGGAGRGVTTLAVVGGVSQVVMSWLHADLATPRAELVEPLVRHLLRVAA